MQSTKQSLEDLSKDNDMSEPIFRMDSLESESKSEVSPIVPEVKIKPENPPMEVSSEPKSGKKKRRKKSMMKKKNQARKVSNAVDIPNANVSVAEVSISESTQESNTDLKGTDSTTDQGSMDSNGSDPEMKDVQ